MMEAVSLSNRLQTVADMVTGRRVADIGCDHGFVSIYLVQAKKADHVLAADVRPGPLSRAQQHIKEVQLTPYIETRLSDGLAGVTPEDRVDTVILAGMGGRLMRRILGELDRLPVQELVLQPQSEWEELRAFLYEQAYLIVESIIRFCAQSEKGRQRKVRSHLSRRVKICRRKKDRSCMHSDHI